MLELINLRTGTSRLLISSWNPGGTIFTW